MAFRYWAAYKGKLDILLQVWEWAEEKIRKEEINNKLLLLTDIAGMTALHEAACEGKLVVLLNVCYWVNIILRAHLQSDYYPAVMQHH